MRAKNRYRMIVRREGLAPVALADARRTDHVEIVDIDAGEVILYWDLLPRDAKTVARMVRSDLDALDAREFLERWASFAGDEDLR
ncbi:MAG: hypothetical protein M3P44_13895 [Actinomycetota bacterium]|nr:hypothetical protein [Actinomycetota bacterium]